MKTNNPSICRLPPCALVGCVLCLSVLPARALQGASPNPGATAGAPGLPGPTGSAAAQGQPGSPPPAGIVHHGPPWKSPVASSQVLHIGGASIQVDFAPGQLDLGAGPVIAWVQRAAQAVTTYYGHFPVTDVRILVTTAPGRAGVLRGTTWGGVAGVQGFSRMVLGQNTTSQQLIDDWTMTHELTHMAFPSLPDDQHWMEEGLATYVEPVARVQAGELQPQKIWGDMMRDMGKGEPQAGDQGLDQTHTWGRTYWGGALFCLVADVTIREKSNNREGLQDALRAIVAAGGTIDHDWPLPQALSIGDNATGTTVLSDLYAQMGRAAVPVDLDQLWMRLGVKQTAGGVVFDDKAPLAAVRAAITAAPK